jgi:hypothetical protein
MHRKFLAAMFLLSASLLACSGGEKPPNTTVSGIVDSAKRLTTTNRLFGGSTSFQLRVKGDEGKAWYAYLSAARLMRTR